VGFTEVLIGGNGWAIYLGHAPSEGPKIETYAKPNPLDNRSFLSEALEIANKAIDGVRKAIAHDWPHRALNPDQDGTVVHPLFAGASAEWYCYHCDARTGAEISANMWHCPKCSAAPLDMHPTAWWKS
jgi:hypothetical protein